MLAQLTAQTYMYAHANTSRQSLSNGVCLLRESRGLPIGNTCRCLLMNNSLAWKRITHWPSFIHTNQMAHPNLHPTVNITIAYLSLTEKCVCSNSFSFLQKLSWEREIWGWISEAEEERRDLRGWHEQQLVGSLSSLTSICSTDVNSPLPFTICVCGLTTLILLWLTNIWEEFIFVTIIQMLCSMWLPPASGSLEPNPTTQLECIGVGVTPQEYMSVYTHVHSLRKPHTFYAISVETHFSHAGVSCSFGMKFYHYRCNYSK